MVERRRKEGGRKGGGGRGEGTERERGGGRGEEKEARVAGGHTGYITVTKVVGGGESRMLKNSHSLGSHSSSTTCKR